MCSIVIIRNDAIPRDIDADSQSSNMLLLQSLQDGEMLSAASSMTSLSDVEAARVAPPRMFNPK